MKRIRIGNDISVQVAITRNGLPEDFTGKTYTLYLNTPFKRIQITDYTMYLNILSFTYLGKDQTNTGDYSITFKEILSDGSSQNIVDSFIVFKLVRCSVEAGGADSGGVQTSAVNVGMDVLLDIGTGFANLAAIKVGGKTYTAVDGVITLPSTLKDYGILDTDVTAQKLTGFVSGQNTSILPSDSILSALGKIQAMINALNTGGSEDPDGDFLGLDEEGRVYIKGSRILRALSDVDILGSLSVGDLINVATGIRIGNYTAGNNGHGAAIMLDPVTGETTLEVDNLDVRGVANINSDSFPILKSTDQLTAPSDANVFSALRSLAEMATRSLSRLNEDTAQGKITFNNGIIIRKQSVEESNTPDELNDAAIEESDNPDELNDAGIEELSGGDVGKFDDLTDADGFSAAQEGTYVLQKGADGIYRPIPGTGGGGGGGDLARVYLTNNLDSRNLTVQAGAPAVLRFTFNSEDRQTSDGEWQATGEQGSLVIQVQNNNIPSLTTVYEATINSAQVINVDVREFLASGTNTVAVKVTGNISLLSTTALTYTVTVTNLSVSSPNFPWWMAKTADIALPLYITGNLSKKLFVGIQQILPDGSTGNYSQEYEVNIGTAVWTETPYQFTIPFPNLDGLFRVSVYVSNQDETLVTPPITWEIVCTLSTTTTPYVAINNIASPADNWAENILFEYAIIDGVAATAAAEFVVKYGTTTINDSQLAGVATQTRQTFSLPLEVETESDDNFTLDVTVKRDALSLHAPFEIQVANSVGYSPVAGAAFFMNPKVRSNNQANREVIINQMNGAAIGAEWSNMSWSLDGWMSDDNGVSVLRILAGQNVAIDYKPFNSEAAQVGKTIEIDFLVRNVTDSSLPILTIATGTNDTNYNGFKLYPNLASMFSQSAKNASAQQLPLDDEVRIRLVLTITPSAYALPNYNRVALYVDGKVNRMFAYANNDYFQQAAKILIGSETADIDIYALRVYDIGLTSEGVHRNYIATLDSNVDKATEQASNDVMTTDGGSIDFAKARQQMNVMVIDQRPPNYLTGNVSITTGTNFWWYPKGAADFSLTWLANRFRGQGTSSMTYYKWNWRCDRIVQVGGVAATKVPFFDGEPSIGYFTAKINWASSMQDHKAGATALFNDAYKQLGLSNDFTDDDPTSRVAIHQVPCVCFYKYTDEEQQVQYEFLGEFTVGADKGDEATFNYDEDKFPAGQMVEGADNSPAEANFLKPFTAARMTYNEDEESLQNPSGQNCWDLDWGADASYFTLFKQAYNIAYQCSQKIAPFAGTLADLQAQASNIRNSGLEYWLTGTRDLYFYEPADGTFHPSDIDDGNGTINLITQLVDKGYGLTADMVAAAADDNALNVLFCAARVAKFRAEAGNFWNIQSLLLQQQDRELFAGTDERAKNTYFRIALVDGKFSVIIDDTDTRNRIDNRGQDNKPPYIEVHDNYPNGQPYFNGNDSVLWDLLLLAFPAEANTMQKSYLDGLQALSGVGTGKSLERLYACYTKYFVGIKRYFPARIINTFSKFYEDAKNDSRYSNDTDPLSQVHGDFFSAETNWIRLRLIYIMSKYSYGLFSAAGENEILFRVAGQDITYNITPAVAMYPAVRNGTSIVRGARTMAGDVCGVVVPLSGAADQQNGIQAADYLSDIGDFYGMQVHGAMTITGKRLQRISLGHKTANIVIAITSLTVAGTPSVRTIILSRITTLVGALNVTDCTHLEEISFDGTGVTQVQLPAGGLLRKIEYADTTVYINLQNFPLLANAGIVTTPAQLAAVTDLLIQDCPNVEPFELLISILSAQDAQGSGHALKRVRLVGINKTYNSGGANILGRLAQLTDGTYQGLTAAGVVQAGYPVIEGSLTLYGNVYQQDIDAVQAAFPALTLTVVGERYIRFVDPEVQRVVANRWGDGTGTTQTQLDAVTAIETSSIFAGNTVITDMSDFGIYFRNLQRIRYQVFQNMTNLTTFYLGHKVVFSTNNIGAFNGCTKLATIDFENIELTTSELQGSLFNYCAFTEVNQDTDNARHEVFMFINNSKLKKYVGVEGLTKCEQQFMYDNLDLCDLPSTMTTVGSANGLFASGGFKVLICRATTPPSPGTLGWGSKQTIYVPDASVDAYKAASGWSSYASIIKPLSQYVPSG
ncbi:MAG: leucine-rich repeat domain-containing protein [Prevotellaceae bacterium]|jgi:hypothetical protein|nr:leucine-rich repeat domain-containing protein [Prevotellaceae bacterium]